MSNIITIDGNTITFTGFSNLKDNDMVTFGFYPSGITIMPYTLNSNSIYKVPVNVHNKKCISDAIVKRLSQRGIISSCSFFFADGKYFEDNPHKA